MNASSRKARSLIGLLAIIICWITSALTVPLVATLKGRYSSEELLIVRSLFSVVFAAIASKGRVGTHWRTVVAGSIMGLSSVFFYRAVQIWGVNPTMVILACLPVLNVAIAVWEKKPVTAKVIGSLMCILIGVTIALEPWHIPLNWHGLLYACSCNIAAAVGFELWGRAPKDVSIFQKGFWVGFTLLIVSVVIMAAEGRAFAVTKFLVPEMMRTFLFFGIACGIVFIYSSIIPFGMLETYKVSILLQGTTPAAIIGAYFLAGESLSAFQWCGVAVALAGTTILSVWTAIEFNEEKQAPLGINETRPP